KPPRPMPSTQAVVRIRSRRSMTRSSRAVPVRVASAASERGLGCVEAAAAAPISGDLLRGGLADAGIAELVTVVAHQKLLQRRRMGHKGADLQLGQAVHDGLDLIAVDLKDAALALGAELMDEAELLQLVGRARSLHLH